MSLRRVSPDSSAALDFFLDREKSADARLAAASKVSGYLGPAQLSRLVGLLRNADESEAYSVAAILSQTRTKRATRALLRILSCPIREHAKLAILHALERLHDARCTRQVVSILNDRRNGEELRAKAADALSSFSRRGYVREALVSALNDESPNVRYAAMLALLSEAGRPAVLSHIRRLLADSGTTWEGFALATTAKAILDAIDPTTGT